MERTCRPKPRLLGSSKLRTVAHLRNLRHSHHDSYCRPNCWQSLAHCSSLEAIIVTVSVRWNLGRPYLPDYQQFRVGLTSYCHWLQANMHHKNIAYEAIKEVTVCQCPTSSSPSFNFQSTWTHNDNTGLVSSYAFYFLHQCSHNRHSSGRPTYRA